MIFKNLQSVPLLRFSTLKKLFKMGQNTLVKTLIKISFNSHSTYFFMASRNMDFEYLIPVTNHYCKQIVTPTDSLCTMLKKPVKQCNTKQFLLGFDIFSIFLTYIFFRFKETSGTSQISRFLKFKYIVFFSTCTSVQQSKYDVDLKSTPWSSNCI